MCQQMKFLLPSRRILIIRSSTIDLKYGLHLKDPLEIVTPRAIQTMMSHELP